ncbi:hypothetical protein TrRE_jg8245 [Triparma retinervis]|uniref:Glycoside hydrolase family 5 domain-containing protein n=1 Tax=Triparma retinervis TaxID=2557542 RepID=A0A9W7L338_9STRA|nr:hypothetical protein TrRE_jg8245 [Triparma retinervis]
MVDAYGRVRLFHGLNDISNSPGQGEAVGVFDGNNYLPRILLANDTRLDFLVNDLGFNSFRVSAAWAALHPTPPSPSGDITPSSSYLSALSAVVDKLSSFGAYTLLDMHQDGLSSSWGSYDGVPKWLANLTTPRHEYPWPWRDESSAPSDVPEAPAQCFGDIYHNTHGMRDYWASFWRTVADSFKSNESVLGYELMNEPWAGDVYRDPALMLPGPREVDDSTLIFFEPVVWGMVHDGESEVDKLVGSGFEHAPGGEEYGSRSVFSFHYYCFFAKNGDGENYPWVEKGICDDLFGPAVFNAVDETARRLGSGSMMTEFGGTFFSPSPSQPSGRSQEELLWVLEESDRHLQSWSFWDLGHFYDYKSNDPFGDPPQAGCKDGLGCEDLKVLSRPYAQAVAGVPTSMRYDQATGVFTLVYKGDKAIAQPTEVFLPPHVYPGGYDIELEGGGAVWDACEEGDGEGMKRNVVCVWWGAGGGEGGESSTVALTVTPK